jgi:hypothetical protein
LDTDPPDKPRRHFFDVDWFHKVNSGNVRKRGRLSRITDWVSGGFDSFQGFFLGMLGAVILLGTLGMAAAGFYFGPLAFLGIFAGTIGGVAFLADRKVGKSLQFDDSGLLKKLLSQVLAFGLSIGMFLFIIFVLPSIMAFRLF